MGNEVCVAVCTDAVVLPIAAGGGAELPVCGYEADEQHFHSSEEEEGSEVTKIGASFMEQETGIVSLVWCHRAYVGPKKLGNRKELDVFQLHNFT